MKSMLGLIFVLVLSPFAHAQKSSGSHSFGFGLGFASPDQGDLNKIIDTKNSGGTAIDKLGSGYELQANYQYRFKGTMFALQFRPSYFMQSSDGSGYKFDLTGFTVFPLFRIYPLENNFIKFFMQTGVGYGNLSGKINAPGGSVAFSSGAFGALAGLGADFCFFGGSHCFGFEGNLRYLPFVRNLVSSSSGTPDGWDPVSGNELENGNSDVGTTLSGMSGTFAYRFNF